jgi:hypothetical protein
MTTDLFSQYPESSFLSLVLQNPDVLDDVKMISPFMLSSSPNRNLYESVLDIYKNGIKPEYGLIIAKLQEKMQMLENGGVTAFGNIKLAVISTFDAMAAYNEKLATSIDEMNKRIVQAIESFLESSFVNIGEALGEMFSGNSDLGQTMLQTLAGLLRQLGEIAIQTGIGLLAIKSSLKTINPGLAIAAGVALIAFSSLITSSIKDAGAFANGGVVGGNSYYGDRLYARVNSGELILNQKQQASIWNGLNRSGGESFMGSLETRVKGEDLLIVLDRANKKKNRKG